MGRLTIHRYRAFYRVMRRKPPTHWLVAAFMGWKPPADSSPESDVDIRDLFDAIPGADGAKSLTLGMLPLLGLL